MEFLRNRQIAKQLGTTKRQVAKAKQGRGSLSKAVIAAIRGAKLISKGFAYYLGKLR